MKKNTFYKCILVLVLDVFLVGGYIVLYGYIEQSRIVAENITSTVENERATQENGSSLRKVAHDTAGIRDDLSSRYILPSTVPNFLEKIESFASTTKTRVVVDSVGVAPLDSITASSSEYLLVSVSGEGSFGRVMQLVEMIESLPNASFASTLLLRTNGFISDSKKGSGVSDWSADITFKVLKKKNE